MQERILADTQLAEHLEHVPRPSRRRTLVPMEEPWFLWDEAAALSVLQASLPDELVLPGRAVAVRVRRGGPGFGRGEGG